MSYCCKCNVEVEDKVVQYSEKKYGKILCRGCQKKNGSFSEMVLSAVLGKKKRVKKMRRCMKCGEYNVSNSDHDFCRGCFSKVEKSDSKGRVEDSFKEDLVEGKIYTVYIMFYGDKNKIGYTADLNARVFELKRQYENNKFVYFREFTSESEARRFEAWLKKLSARNLTRFVCSFQDKTRKIEFI